MESDRSSVPMPKAARKRPPFAATLRLIILFALGAYAATLAAQAFWQPDPFLDQILLLSAVVAGLGVMARLLQVVGSRPLRLGFKLVAVALALSLSWGLIVALFLIRIGLLGSMP